MMAKPIILFVLHMPPPVHGAALMGKYIHDSKLINDTFDCHYINLASAKKLEDIGKVGLSKVWLILRLICSVYKKIKELRPALVYVTPTSKGGAFFKDFVVVQLLKCMGCRVVLHYHNKGVAAYSKKPLFNMLYRSFFKKVKVILLAESLYSDIRKYVARKDVYICPNGIPGESLLQCNNSVDELPHLLFLSNLLINKGILVLLDACQLLKRGNIPFVCDVVGGETFDFSRESFQKEILDRGLSDRVIYHGRLYGDDKNKMFRRSTVFVLPTVDECFPLVLLEAMQQGVPCVATDEGGIPAIIEDGVSGYLIPKKNPQILAEKMKKLILDKKTCKEMGKAGYQHYLRSFTLDAFEKKMIDVLSRLLTLK